MRPSPNLSDKGKYFIILKERVESILSKEQVIIPQAIEVVFADQTVKNCFLPRLKDIIVKWIGYLRIGIHFKEVMVWLVTDIDIQIRRKYNLAWKELNPQ